MREDIEKLAKIFDAIWLREGDLTIAAALDAVEEWLPKNEPAREAKEECDGKSFYCKHISHRECKGCNCQCHKPQNTDCSEQEKFEKLIGFKCEHCQDKTDCSQCKTCKAQELHDYVTDDKPKPGSQDKKQECKRGFPFCISSDCKQEEPEREDKGHSKKFIDALSHQVDLIQNKLQDQEEFVDAMSGQVDKNINRIDKMDKKQKEFQKDILYFQEWLDEKYTSSEFKEKIGELRKKYL